MSALLDRVVVRALGAAPGSGAAVRLEQRGQIRLAPGKPWLPFRARQTLQATAASFVWAAKVRMAPFTWVRIVDAFEQGRGHLEVRLWRLFPLADASGPELDAGELLRYLAELPWCPFAYRGNPDIEVQATSETELSVRASSTRGTEEVILTVDPSGDVVGVRAEARPRLVGREYRDLPWSGVFYDHGVLGGLRIPRRAAVTWHLDDGPFECWRGEITALHLLPTSGKSGLHRNPAPPLRSL